MVINCCYPFCDLKIRDVLSIKKSATVMAKPGSMLHNEIGNRNKYHYLKSMSSTFIKWSQTTYKNDKLRKLKGNTINTSMKRKQQYQNLCAQIASMMVFWSQIFYLWKGKSIFYVQTDGNRIFFYKNGKTNLIPSDESGINFDWQYNSVRQFYFFIPSNQVWNLVFLAKILTKLIHLSPPRRVGRYIIRSISVLSYYQFITLTK